MSKLRGIHWLFYTDINQLNKNFNSSYCISEHAFQNSKAHKITITTFFYIQSNAIFLKDNYLMARHKSSIEELHSKNRYCHNLLSLDQHAFKFISLD